MNRINSCRLVAIIGLTILIFSEANNTFFQLKVTYICGSLKGIDCCVDCFINNRHQFQCPLRQARFVCLICRPDFSDSNGAAQCEKTNKKDCAASEGFLLTSTSGKENVRFGFLDNAGNYDECYDYCRVLTTFGSFSTECKQKCNSAREKHEKNICIKCKPAGNMNNYDAFCERSAGCEGSQGFALRSLKVTRKSKQLAMKVTTSTTVATPIKTTCMTPLIVSTTAKSKEPEMETSTEEKATTSFSGLPTLADEIQAQTREAGEIGEARGLFQSAVFFYVLIFFALLAIFNLVHLVVTLVAWCMM